ncbi:hypothetical protein [Methylophilus sp.]|nr:hypothetical protein [Methylophilus sp.]
MQQKQHYNTILSFVAVQIHIQQPIYQKQNPRGARFLAVSEGFEPSIQV